MSSGASRILGIAGAARNAALALCDGPRVMGVCEQERITRTRRASLKRGQLPIEALHAMLALGRCTEDQISTYAVAESAIQLPADRSVEYVDHHAAHAATAFYTSALSNATILVCDRHGSPELTVWRGDGDGITPLDFGWTGPAFASIYAQAAEAFGWRPGDEHRLEALARVGDRSGVASLPTIQYGGSRLDVPPQFQACVSALIGRNGSSASAAQRAALAGAFQHQLGQVLLQVVADIRRRFDGTQLCLGGGLFYNSYFTTLLAESGLYEDMFIPANPGNAGVAVGAALTVASRQGPLGRREPLAPFLGPEFSPQEIKAILDNCKLSYDYLRNGQVIDRATAALTKGQLVGWFQGRMEWGSRALGNRSILASPVAPYVLENLNVFLKHREPHRTYSVSVCAEDVNRYFRGPARSTFMEYEYDVIDRDLLRGLLPDNATRLRVQTVDASAGVFYELLRAFGDATGVPILVNTSFNGFNEPIVCNPRDAIRVFYGTGLDLAVLGGLVLQK